MKFLEAKKILRNTQCHQTLDMHLLCSSQTENLSPYLEAFFAKQAININILRLPFGTLRQNLIVDLSNDKNVYNKHNTVLLVFAWDFSPSLDWRQWGAERLFDIGAIQAEIKAFISVLSNYTFPVIYVDAPIAPVVSHANELRSIRSFIKAFSVEQGLSVLDENCFSLDGYMESGLPVANSFVPFVCEKIIEQYSNINQVKETKKVLITDLDNTAWQGIVGEDGVNGIKCEKTGTSKRHYLYQVLLKRLVDSGAVLCVVSKNDLDLAQAPFQGSPMPLSLGDISIFKAGYGFKSDMIKALSKELNLPLSSMIFIDDNPVEIAEVESTLTDVECHIFPSSTQELLLLIDSLYNDFSTYCVTQEDENRARLYKMRESAETEKNSHNSIASFLTGLNMKMSVCEHTHTESIDRAVQLINKTNQFNLNGLRISKESVAAHLTKGGKVFTASLSDKFGDHGEVIACLVDPSMKIVSFVMSCRVLQRQAEHRFLLCLLNILNVQVLQLDYKKTQRNTPLTAFFDSLKIDLDAEFISADVTNLIAKLQPSTSYIACQKIEQKA